VFAYIKYLKSKVKNIEAQKAHLSEEVYKLNLKMVDLKTKMNKLNEELLTKQVTLGKLAEKINDLETKIGLRGNIEFESVDIKNLTPEEINKLLIFFPNGSPIKGRYKITSKFGWRIHPILKKREFHPGIDLRRRGKVPVYATANGIVAGAGKNPYGYGYVVKLINGYGFTTLYAHLRPNIKVKTGQFVKKGQIIGYMGNTGLSTGQHLHYEVRYNNKPLNPLYFMYWSGKNFYKIFKLERRVPWESLIKASLSIITPQKKQH